MLWIPIILRLHMLSILWLHRLFRDDLPRKPQWIIGFPRQRGGRHRQQPGSHLPGSDPRTGRQNDLQPGGLKKWDFDHVSGILGEVHEILIGAILLMVVVFGAVAPRGSRACRVFWKRVFSSFFSSLGWGGWGVEGVEGAVGVNNVLWLALCSHACLCLWFLSYAFSSHLLLRHSCL